MKIQFTEHCPDPTKRGTTTNLPRHVAEPLIAQGVAVEVKPRRLDDFMRDHATAGVGGGNVPVPYFETAVWDIVTARGDAAKFVLRRRIASETDFCSDPELAERYGCPAEVLTQFRALPAEQKLTPATDSRTPWGHGLRWIEDKK